LQIKIIDTDNTVDFTVSAQKALCDLDGAILVISGTNGVESAIKVNGFMEGLKVPRFLLIDELDKKGANPWEVLEKVSFSFVGFLDLEAILFNYIIFFEIII
jgi:translation elongation factor EF-G